jgi:hypothetical protein
MHMMAKSILALLIFMLFINPKGLIDLPNCAMQHPAIEHTCDHAEQFETILPSNSHACDCGTALLPSPAWWATTPLIILFFATNILIPNIAIKIPPTPPPRFG